VKTDDDDYDDYDDYDNGNYASYKLSLVCTEPSSEPTKHDKFYKCKLCIWSRKHNVGCAYCGCVTCVSQGTSTYE